MSGPKFVLTLFGWIVFTTFGGVLIFKGVTENVLAVAIPFGVVWIGLVTYWAWKFGNSSEGGR